MTDPRFDHRALLEETAGRASAYLATLPDRPVAPPDAAVAILERWSEEASLEETGRPAAEVLRELDATVSPATVASAGPRYFGLVTGGCLPAALAAQWLAATWDQNAASLVSSPAGIQVARVASRWLLDVLGLPPASSVSLCTGATVANLTALAAARHRVLADAGWDVDADGLFGAPEITVLVSEEIHPTVRKGLGLLGLGRDRVIGLAVDGQGRIRPDALPDVAAPAILCAQAGNVNSGASDPFVALRAWCDAHGAWLHVDGAFGLWAQASPATRDLTAGVERADSWATDAHKWLNVPYDCGLAVVRDAADLRAAMSIAAPYLVAGAAPEPLATGLQASQRARGVEVFAALRSLGRAGLAELVERTCRHARRFAAGLEAAGFAVLNDVVLNQVVVRFGDAPTNAAIIDRVQRSGTCWLGPTRWQGHDAARISVSGWATSEADVDRSLSAILEAAAACRGPEERAHVPSRASGPLSDRPPGTGPSVPGGEAG